MAFTLKGVHFRVSTSYCVLVCLALCFDRSYFVAIVVASTTAHELGHLVAMFCLGATVKGVYLEPFGVIIRGHTAYLPRWKLVVITVSGIGVNFLLSLVFWLLYKCNSREVFLTVFGVNVCLASFNLLPITGLDGGDLLALLLPSEKGKSVTKIISLVTTGLLVAFGFYLSVFYTFNFTLLVVTLNLIFIAVFREFKG